VLFVLLAIKSVKYAVCYLTGLDSDIGNFTLQAAGALSPNATSDFRLPSKNLGSVAVAAMQIRSVTL